MPDHDGAGRSADTVWARLEDQLDWYDRRSAVNQRNYKATKLIQLVAAATITVLAAVPAPALGAALLAAFLLVLEAVQQLYQWQTNWILYRSTAEALKHEKYLYLAGAGPYAIPDKHRVLAERLEGLVSQEHAKWTEARTEAAEANGHL